MVGIQTHCKIEWAMHILIHIREGEGERENIMRNTWNLEAYQCSMRECASHR